MTNGARRILDVLVENGIDTVFTNPGTSEMHLVAALEERTDVRTILGLSETVVTGAADGYARMRRRPAATLLHLGPGLANGWANLHNARRARSPIVSLVGDHALDHLALDAPLTSDIAALAGALGPVFHPMSADELIRDVGEAIGAARRAPGRIANAIIPADLAWGAASEMPNPMVDLAEESLDGSQIVAAVDALRVSERPALLLGGWAATGAALETAAGIATATGAQLIIDTFLPRLDHGVGSPAVHRLPYHARDARRALEEHDTVVCIGTGVPVPFFAYPNESSHLIDPSTTTVVLDHHTVDPEHTLVALADHLRVEGDVSFARNTARDDQPEPTSGPITPRSLAIAVAAAITEDAVLIDEAISSAGGLLGASRGAPPHHWLQLTGGAIGQALPLSVGAALGADSPRITAIVGDGSAMYSMPALWTLARENLDVTIVICTNRRYAILDDEWRRTGAATEEAGASTTFALDDPDLDAATIADGFGVPGETVSDAAALRRALDEAADRPGPTLIDAVMYEA